MAVALSVLVPVTAYLARAMPPDGRPKSVEEPPKLLSKELLAASVLQSSPLRRTRTVVINESNVPVDRSAKGEKIGFANVPKEPMQSDTFQFLANIPMTISPPTSCQHSGPNEGEGSSTYRRSLQRPCRRSPAHELHYPTSPATYTDTEGEQLRVCHHHLC